METCDGPEVPFSCRRWLPLDDRASARVRVLLERLSLPIDSAATPVISWVIMARTTLGTKYSEAARLLWEHAVERHWTHADLSRYLGSERVKCNTGMLSRWLWGDRKPSRQWAARIQKKIKKIKLDLWDAAAVALTLPVSNTPRLP